MMNIYIIVASILVGMILLFQAISDAQTKEIYVFPTYMAIILGLPIVIVKAAALDWIYIIICVVFLLIEVLLKIFAPGDGKLFLVILEFIILRKSNIDIFIELLLTEIFATIIFIAYVVFIKLLKKEKLSFTDGHAYAPAIFLVYLFITIGG